DLYYGVTPPDRIERLAREMGGFGPDAAVIAGDLAESLPDFVRCLKLFRQALACPVWVLPGDREFWARPPHDSRRLWQNM
ncbi:metallophosphoesterase, partial [Klebsiella pneumoniae]|nr:metallophosphoesterase [Klebsiella pneumoniae]